MMASATVLFAKSVLKEKWFTGFPSQNVEEKSRAPFETGKGDGL